MTRLGELRARLADQAVPDPRPDRLDRLGVVQAGGALHVAFFGDPFGAAYGELLEALTEAPTASRLGSIDLAGPDEGANGTRNWDLSALVDPGVTFPNLTAVAIERARPGDHNATVVASEYDEAGVLGRLLALAPRLESLTSPSAPDASFFRAGARPLRHLAIDAGYDHQGFLRNLAASSGFPGLASVEYGEYREGYMADFAERVTPFEDYEALFASPAFAAVRQFVWRNPACSDHQIRSLKARAPGCAIQVVRWSAEWV